MPQAETITMMITVDPWRVPVTVAQIPDTGLHRDFEADRAAREAIAEAGKDRELQGKIRIQGINPQDIGLEKFDEHIRNDMVRLEPLLKSIEKR